MTVKTIANLKADIATDIPDNTSGRVSPADVRGSMVDAVDTIHSAHGWAFYDDSQYTSASPLTIDNARTQLTIDGLGAANETGYLPSGVGALWAGNKITPENLGDSYIVRLDFTAKTSTSNGYAELQLDIGGGGSIVIYNQEMLFPKGINSETKFSFAVPIYCLATFLANGGKFYIDSTVDPSNITVYDVGLFISRTSKGE